MNSNQTSEINGILGDDVWNPTYFFFPTLAALDILIILPSEA
jgi:hypothetical protein